MVHEFVTDDDMSLYHPTIVATYLFMALAYKNWQRPGAILNLTTDEANSAKTRTDSIIITSAVHKTSYTHGPAVMVLKGNDALSFNKWRNANHQDVPASISPHVQLPKCWVCYSK